MNQIDDHSKQNGVVVYSGWIRNSNYLTENDMVPDVTYKMDAMIDIHDTKAGWQVLYPDIDEVISIIKGHYPGLADGTFEVFDGPYSYIISVRRRTDQYDLAIFKVLKGSITLPVEEYPLAD